jgi:hypothetical protein
MVTLDRMRHGLKGSGGYNTDLNTHRGATEWSDRTRWASSWRTYGGGNDRRRDQGRRLSPGKIIVSDISAERRDLLSKKYGVTVTEDNGTVAKRSETVILAIKPQTFGDIAAELGTHIAEDQLIVSIMAGWSTGYWQRPSDTRP